MTTFEFLSYLRSLGVKVWAEGDKLRYQALESALLPSLKAELAKRKSDILQVLGELKTNAQPARLSIRPIAEGHQSPLSFSQQRLWFLNQLEPDSAFYTELAPVRMKGRLDVPVLERTLSEIVRRHEAVRTIFPAIDGHPTQVIQPAHFLKLRIDDLSLLPQDERELEIRRLIKAEAQRPFDLAQGPLMRVRLLRLSLNEHVMVVTMHHIITDGWSMGVLVREVGALYQAFASGNPSPLSELPIQYADYARWQRQWMSGEILESQLRYWRQQLGGELPVLDLPTDRPRPAKQSFNGARHTVVLGLELSRKLEVMSREQGVTLFMTLLATFQILLHRYTSQTDVRVGSPVANRTRAETEELIGLFVNTLVLRADLSGNPSYCELLGRVRETALEAYGRQELPFEKLVEELNPERDLSHTPLFQVMFVLQNAPMPALELSGLELTQIEIEPGTAKFDLEFALVETAEGLRGWFEYNTALFDEVSIDRTCGHYRRLLVEAVAKPEERLSNLPLLTEAESRQLLIEWNETKPDYPDSHCLHQLFETQVAQTPDAVAVVFEQERVTYRELNRRANQLASSLQRLGVGLEGLVALLAERGVDFLSTALAIFKTGAAYIPLDPYYPAQRVCQILSQSRAAFVITAPQFEALAAEAADGLVSESRPAIFSLDELLKDLRQEGYLGAHFPPSRLAYVIFTSGSTGAPKGAMVEQCGMLNHLFAKIQALGLNDRDVVAQTASQCFDISVWQFIAVLLVGGTVHIFGDDITHDPASLLDQVELQRVTILEVVPSMMRMMLKESDQRQVKPDLSRLRWLIPTGEALPPDLCRHWLRLYPEIPLLNAYGPTECSDDVTHCPIVEPLAGDTVCVSIGRPIANTQIYVLNTGFHPQPVGVVGALCIAGAGVGRGYLNEAAKTAESFVPAAFAIEAGTRMYKSGDLACYLPDGNLKCLGRIDHQVKIRGFRIELGEIEAALGRHPAVQESIVVVREYLHGEKRLVAYYVTKPETALSISELRDFLKQELPEYMAPAAYVKLEALPLTENGKLDRRALPAPDGVWLRLEQGYVAPRTLIEQTLAEIWSQLLGVDRIGVHDEFFELGGHSLLATQAISRVRAAFQVELPLKELFERPTISGLALSLKQMLKAGGGLQAPPLIRTARTGRLPLSFAQQRLWFIEQLKPEISVYNCPGALRLEGRLNLEALESTINEIVRRHEALRTRIELEEGAPVQVIDEWQPRNLEVKDLRRLGAEEREEEVRRIMREEAKTGFDLRRGPLIRVKVLKLGEEEHVALFTAHHIASDAWSMGVLAREICVLYQAFSEGEVSPLPELKIQYADYAYWQRQYLRGSALERHLAYWKKQLGGKLPVLDLPTDYPRPSIPSYRGSTKSFLLPVELSQSLRSLIRREGVTLFMLLLAAFKTLLYKYTAQEDIIIGTSAENRNRTEIEPLIGFFVNTLPMRTYLGGNPTFRELLKRVKEVALGGYAHQDLPFEKLVEEIQPERAVRQMPLFNVVFGVQNAPREDLRLRGIEIKPMVAEQEGARFDLAIWVTEGHEQMQVSWVYSKDLFEADTVVYMHDHFEILLSSIVDRPDARLTNLDISPWTKISPNPQGPGYREAPNIEEPLSIKRRGINLFTKPV